jgi:hypothetical protein
MWRVERDERRGEHIDDDDRRPSQPQNIQQLKTSFFIIIERLISDQITNTSMELE